MVRDRTGEASTGSRHDAGASSGNSSTTSKAPFGSVPPSGVASGPRPAKIAPSAIGTKRPSSRLTSSPSIVTGALRPTSSRQSTAGALAPRGKMRRSPASSHSPETSRVMPRKITAVTVPATEAETTQRTSASGMRIDYTGWSETWDELKVIV